MSDTRIPFIRRLADLAAADPERPAVTVGDHGSVSRAELDRASTALARQLLADGVSPDRLVTISLPNSLEWFVAVVACWKVGATPQPVSAALPGPELEAIVELADSAVVIGADGHALGDRPCVTRAAVRNLLLAARGPGEATGTGPADGLPEVVSSSWKAPTSGGSTGRPKLILSGDPAVVDLAPGPPLFLGEGGALVMPGPLYHNGPLIWALYALLWGNHVSVLERFDAEATLAAIERHRAQVVYLVPTMMKRIWRLPTDVRTHYDLSSLRVVWHLAEPCPVWLKEAWIEWLGPERIIELYGGTEAQLSTIISGVEWLAHRGSVGRPVGGSIKVCDEAGNEVPPGTEGELWLKSARPTPSYRYVGAEARTMDGGWESLGDMGWLDDDGYLYLGDRKSDMILTGGANVYPAEVESALQEHPAVRSCAVVGVPDDDLGRVVHAVVEADAETVTADELRAYLGERLVRYKVPRTFAFVDTPLRDDAGKVRRYLLSEVTDVSGAGA